MTVIIGTFGTDDTSQNVWHRINLPNINYIIKRLFWRKHYVLVTSIFVGFKLQTALYRTTVDEEIKRLMTQY